MPYPTKDDLPESVKGNLPAGGEEMKAEVSAKMAEAKVNLKKLKAAGENVAADALHTLSNVMSEIRHQLHKTKNKLK